MAVSLQELGDQVKAARNDKGVSQEALAQTLGDGFNRSQIAHLEQGIRVPPEGVLADICTKLGVPKRYWEPFTDPEFRLRLDFEEAISELVGEPITLRFVDEHADKVANKYVQMYFSKGRSEQQSLDFINSILVFYDVTPMSREFFTKYLKVDSTKSPKDLLDGVREFQKEAIRLFSTFREAYREMNKTGGLELHRKPLEPRDLSEYHSREPWEEIELVPEVRLPDLGYISAKAAREEANERRVISDFLRETADRIEQEGKQIIEQYSTKKKLKMSSLLRKFESHLEHDFMSTLFSPDPNMLRREADVIAPKDTKDLDRIASTQAQAQRNLARYLAADYLDVYVATSMRVDADFISVNRFTQNLFCHPDVKKLNLRFFNPTQSWIDDRVAKGLVEALMLRRSQMTIYMAQKGDTFGKDSEASVALGQGKPVIVYVPKLTFKNIDSEIIGALPRSELERFITSEGSADDVESDPTMDQDALVSRLLTIRLEKINDSSLTTIVKEHWADFDLYGEDLRVGKEESSKGKLREVYRSWLDDIIKHDRNTPVPTAIKADVVGILVATSMRFEGRAKVFRDVHPLALQVIVSTGVLNGILVARSVDSCAKLIENLIKNDLEFELCPEAENYRLVERSTMSTARVISRHTLIKNSFSSFYSRENK
ncbi:helix-turn-helix domain-containing protein [Gallaecimonas xiamenensis]|uniref:XRE family transcriptional regulator n=1 Tax=Gallaecimonas xiamenensis 3-C-1 TaxID=745411 RepID=K2J2E8_9GAMM|nr:helix-turn-helix transcriptional regulator [Gallaecimonas xiamenensis]EKE77136.1 XRE family transcriptional regulator [Gallaecimonas xiamenensis 3-C-1]